MHSIFNIFFETWHFVQDFLKKNTLSPWGFNGALSACERAARPELAARSGGITSDGETEPGGSW